MVVSSGMHSADMNCHARAHVHDTCDGPFVLLV